MPRPDLLASLSVFGANSWNGTGSPSTDSLRFLSRGLAGNCPSDLHAETFLFPPQKGLDSNTKVGYKGLRHPLIRPRVQ